MGGGNKADSSSLTGKGGARRMSIRKRVSKSVRRKILTNYLRLYEGNWPRKCGDFKRCEAGGGGTFQGTVHAQSKTPGE